MASEVVDITIAALKKTNEDINKMVAGIFYVTFSFNTFNSLPFPPVGFFSSSNFLGIISKKPQISTPHTHTQSPSVIFEKPSHSTLTQEIKLNRQCSITIDRVVVRGVFCFPTLNTVIMKIHTVRHIEFLIFLIFSKRVRVQNSPIVIFFACAPAAANQTRMYQNKIIKVVYKNYFLSYHFKNQLPNDFHNRWKMRSNRTEINVASLEILIKL
jgi:hypothetical protein